MDCKMPPIWSILNCERNVALGVDESVVPPPPFFFLQYYVQVFKNMVFFTLWLFLSLGFCNIYYSNTLLQMVGYSFEVADFFPP